MSLRIRKVFLLFDKNIEITKKFFRVCGTCMQIIIKVFCSSSVLIIRVPKSFLATLNLFMVKSKCYSLARKNNFCFLVYLEEKMRSCNVRSLVCIISNSRSIYQRDAVVEEINRGVEEVKQKELWKGEGVGLKSSWSKTKYSMSPMRCQR